MAISRSSETFSAVLSMALPLLSFGFAFERLEPLAPELVEKGLQLDETLGPRAVEAPGAVASLAHEPRLLQDAQVLGDRRPRQVEMLRDRAGRELVVGDEPQDRAAVRRGHGFARVLPG